MSGFERYINYLNGRVNRVGAVIHGTDFDNVYIELNSDYLELVPEIIDVKCAVELTKDIDYIYLCPIIKFPILDTYELDYLESADCIDTWHETISTLLSELVHEPYYEGMFSDE